MEKITVKSVEDTKQETNIELTEDQKNIAVDNDLIHYDGREWWYFSTDLPLIESVKRAH